MKKMASRVSALLAIIGLSIVVAGFATGSSQVPTIIDQPEDQMVGVGSTAKITVRAKNGEIYQWFRNGKAIPGKNNASLSFGNIEIKDAGNYSCLVSKGMRQAVTRVAALLVYVKPQAGNSAAEADGSLRKLSSGDPITFYASPIVSSGSSGSCPGNYAGYVIFTKTVSQGWGWAPTSGITSHTAADGGGRSDTILEYVGKYGDEGCNQSAVGVPDPTYSPKYRFAIYFPSDVPTTNYPIVLTGFNP